MSNACGKTVECSYVFRDRLSNACGLDTLSNVSFPGVSAGIFAGAIQANFAGDANYAPAVNTGTLTVFPAPHILTNTRNHLLAIDSVTFVTEPFSVVNLYNLSTDQRTRVMIFTSNLGLTQPSPDLSVTVGAFPLLSKRWDHWQAYQTSPTSFVKLEPVPPGNLEVRITFRGVTSNAGLISISP
jgi:hypothetical protein